jgi:hypothetical protein
MTGDKKVDRWKQLDLQVAKTDPQRVELLELLIDPYTRERVRLRMRADKYRNQCYAIAELWAGSQWQELHVLLDLPPHFNGIPSSTKIDEKLFALARRELLRAATLILDH